MPNKKTPVSGKKKSSTTSAGPHVDVTVMVDDNRKHDLAGVARDLKTKGFVVSQSLHDIGVLTGSAPAAALAALSKVSGVSAVEKGRSDYHTQAS